MTSHWPRVQKYKLGLSIFLTTVSLFAPAVFAADDFSCIDLVRDPHSLVELVGDYDSARVYVRRGADGLERSYVRTNRSMRMTEAVHHMSDGQFMVFMKGRVLDAGCGDGRFVRELKERGVQAQGIDVYLRPDQIVEPELFSQQDMAHLQFDDGTFDTVITTYTIPTYESMSIGYFKDISKKLMTIRVLMELKRVLKPGGHLLIGPIDQHYNFEEVVNFVGGLKIERQSRADTEAAESFVLVRTHVSKQDAFRGFR
jgi:ubiquinone/menaquinone biosynthesis C-methylase UbiE